MRKYLPSTRTDANASWDKGVSVEQIAKLKAAGQFLDLIQWRAHRSNPVGMADDGYVLEWRNFDAGANPFASNMDPKTKQPRYMYDEQKVGRKAFSDRGHPQERRRALIREQNAVPFDPNAGWKAGDLSAAVRRQPEDGERLGRGQQERERRRGRTARGPWCGRARSTSRTPTTRR